MPAFTGDFYAPGDLTVTTPALPVGKPLQLSRDKPIELAWKGTPDGYPVFAQLKQPGTLMICRLTDDGAFTIPATALSAFKPSSSTGGSDPDQLTVQRYSWHMAGEVLIETSSGMTLDVNLNLAPGACAYLNPVRRERPYVVEQLPAAARISLREAT